MSLPSAGVIDACAFHDWSSTADLAPYLSSGWRSILMPKVGRDYWGGPTRVRAHALYTNPLGPKLPGSYPEEGAPGSDLELLCKTLLDGGARDQVVLGYDEAVLTTAFPELYAAKAVVRAANDWTADRWLARDQRLLGLVLVISGLPDEAAAEIRRVGKNERMVGITLGTNSLGIPFGHPIYYPIYEAAIELDLPVIIQVGSELAGTISTPPVAGGMPITYGEYLAWSMQPMMSHIASLIAKGVFELYPSLRVLLVGGGLTWLPGYLWRLNFWYKMDHQSAPWLKKLPSDYFREHFWVTTYQLERSPSAVQIEQTLSTFPGIEERLLYAGGYPNVDSAEPKEIAERLPPAWQPAVFGKAAREVLRWPSTARKVGRQGPAPDASIAREPEPTAKGAST